MTIIKPKFMFIEDKQKAFEIEEAYNAMNRMDLWTKWRVNGYSTSSNFIFKMFDTLDTSHSASSATGLLQTLEEIDILGFVKFKSKHLLQTKREKSSYKNKNTRKIRVIPEINKFQFIEMLSLQKANKHSFMDDNNEFEEIDIN